MRQRIDLHHAFDLGHAIGAGQRVDPVDVHRTGATDAFTARAAEGQRRIDLVLDLDDRVQNHRAAIVQIDEIRIHRRVFAVVRVPTVNVEFLEVLGIRRLGPSLAAGHAGVLGERQLYHDAVPLWSAGAGAGKSSIRYRTDAASENRCGTATHAVLRPRACKDAAHHLHSLLIHARC